MSDGRSVLSLKGDSPVWRGMSDTTGIAPAPGTFEVLEGVVVSRDGTDLVPDLGAQLSGKPFYGQAFSIAAIVVGVGITTITLDATAARDDDAYLPAVFYALFHVTGYGTTPIVGTKTGVNTFTVPVEFTSASLTGYVLIQRVFMEHAMASVDGKPAVVIETSVYDEPTDDTYRNLATAVCKTPLSTTTPPTPGKPDGTDANFVLWPSPTMTALNDCDYGTDTGVTLRKLRHYDIQRRMHVDSLNGRLLIAVPGLGIMFEANVRNHFQTLSTRPPLHSSWPDSRWTKALGLQRAPNHGIPVTASNGGSLTDDSYYTFAIGYYNPATGEAGVPSPPFAIYIADLATDKTLNVKAIYPRGALLEQMGLQIVLYAGLPTPGPSSDANYQLALAAELFPIEHWGPFTSANELSLLATDASTATYYTFVVTTVPSVESQVSPKRFPVMELPPAGASWVKVAKGRMLSGGEMPEWWDMNAWPIAFQKLGFTGALDLEYMLTIPSMWNEISAVPTSGPCAMSQWPTTFGGRQIAEINTANTTRYGLDEGPVNQRVTAVTPLGPHTHQIDFRVNNTGNSDFDVDHDATYRVFTPQERVSVSEEGYPGVCPATSQLPVDALVSPGLTTGCARVGDQATIFTPQQTHLFSWAAMPRFPASNVISNSHGGASTHSIVEGPGFAAWLSMSGPCTWTGGAVRWAGDRLATFWNTVKRDSNGMVICAGASVDLSKTLVIWAVLTNTTSDWTAATTDTLKHKVPCDTLLCWNWTADAFSVQRREDVREITALGTMPYDDGTLKPTISCLGIEHGVYFPLYALDGSVERASAVDEITLTADRNPANSTATFSDTVYFGLGDYAFVRSPDGETCRWLGQLGGVTSVATTSLTLGQASADADGAVWYSGDTLVVGGPHVLMRTHRLHLGDLGGGVAADALVIHADIEASHCYAKITFILPDGTERALKPSWGQRLLNGSTRITGLAVGDDVAIEMTVVADGWFAIKDIAFEASDGSR